MFGTLCMNELNTEMGLSNVRYITKLVALLHRGP